jgi:hypothetical protein
MHAGSKVIRIISIFALRAVGLFGVGLLIGLWGFKAVGS